MLTVMLVEVVLSSIQVTLYGSHFAFFLWPARHEAAKDCC